MASKNKGNPVSNRSKLWMEDTLLKLMQTEKYEEITVQEITDNARLSRRTFYRNYSSKDEIIAGCFLKIWREYESQIRQQTDLTLPNISNVFFSVMQNHVDFLLLLNRHHLLPLLLARVDELLPSTFYELKGAKLPFSQECIEYALIFSAGGFMQLLLRWLNESPRKSPKELSAIVRDCIAIYNYPNYLQR
jgi:AcrR family transcriptional regulator